MSSRKPGYVIGMLLLALVLSAPQIMLVVGTGWTAWKYHRVVLFPIFGFDQYNRWNEYETRTFWRGEFVYSRWNGSDECKIEGMNPETGSVRTILAFPSDTSWFQVYAYGDRIWLGRANGEESYELVNGEWQKAAFVAPPRYHYLMRNAFLWNGEPAFTERTNTGFAISTFSHGAWRSVGDIAFPDFSRERMLGDVPIRVQFKKWGSGQAQIEILNSQDGMHVFLHAGGRILHHKGVTLADSAIAKAADAINSAGSIASFTEKSLETPDSTIQAISTDNDLAGWSLVRTAPIQGFSEKIFYRDYPDCTLGFLLDGRPHALIVDDVVTGSPTGHIYRQDGIEWTEVACQIFPFGSRHFRIVPNGNGESSYLVAMTSMGVANFYAVDASGFRKTKAIESDIEQFLSNLFLPVLILVSTCLLGMVLGGSISYLMWWNTKPDYEFGIQQVKLASLSWRGFSRLIDLGAIGFSTVALGWLLTLNLDWLALADSVNLRIDHPSTHAAFRVAMILAVWLVLSVLAILIAQAVWGITPGKWLCRLRTVRTSLRPCGFASSLAREIVFFVDCCNFICWTPGILSIALTEKRQRLGDFVADTIVVESRSLTSVIS